MSPNQVQMLNQNRNTTVQRQGWRLSVGVLCILPDLEDEIREERESKKGDGGWQAGLVKVFAAKPNI